MLRCPTAFCRGAAKILLSFVRTAETILPTAGDDRPKYRVSDKNIDGYKHLGRLVLTLRNYEE